MLTKPKDVEPNLCSTYREIAKSNGLNLSEMLELINHEFDLNITHSRYSEWEAGKRSPKKEVINFLMEHVLRSKCEDLNLTSSQTKDLIESLRVA